MLLVGYDLLYLLRYTGGWDVPELGMCTHMQVENGDQ